MDIPSIQSVRGLAAVSRGDSPQASGEEFANALSQALKSADDTAKEAEQGTQALLTGSADDISGIIIDAEKADVALRLTIQVRNKVIDAYNEVMRMQV